MQSNPNPSSGNSVDYRIDSEHELYEVEGVERLTQTPLRLRITCPAGMPLEQLVTLLQWSNVLERMRCLAARWNTKAKKSHKQKQEFVLDIRCIRKVGDTLLIRSAFDEDLLPF